jgi:outer membrane lipoprotein
MHAQPYFRCGPAGVRWYGFHDQYSNIPASHEKAAMNKLRILPYLLQTALIIVVFGCAYPISQEMREKANPDLSYPMVARNPLSYKGATIIWGGVVDQEHNQSGQTLLTILETPLDYRGVPDDAIYNRGRFIARIARTENQSPEDYGERKKIILAGDIVGEETKEINGKQLHYPVVQVKELHLFPQRHDSHLYRPGDYQDLYGYPDYDRNPFQGIQ